MATRKTDEPKGILNPSTHRAKIPLHRYAPSESLVGVVEHYWVVEWNLPKGETYRSENLPYPSVHIVFEHPLSLCAGGAYRALEAVFGPSGRRLREAVAAEDDVDARIRLVEEFLLARGGSVDRRAALANEVIDYVISARGVRRVSALEERFGMSARALQELFRACVGVAPKWVIRSFRIHEALEHLHAGTVVDTGLLAVELGYTDQAHFIKDFKAMTGLTPARYNRTNVKKKGRGRETAAPQEGPRRSAAPD